MKNRSMPSSVIVPELGYSDVRAAVDWLCRTFGFAERLRIGTHRAQLSFGDGSVVVYEQRADSGVWSLDASTTGPLPASGFGHSVMVRVPDVTKHYEHAKQTGAWIISPPTDFPYGERQYTVEDLGGHRWTFSQTIADVDPSTWGALAIE